MKNYTLRRSLKMFLYFFGMYALLTSIWFGISGQFKGDLQKILTEIFVSALVFSLGFGLLMAIWYRRRELRIPLAKLSQATLEKLLQEVGYEKSPKQKAADYKVYMPVPPKATRMAGKLFLSKSANFYFIEGPARYLNQVEKQLVKKK